jgi:hypothetical protein
MQIPIESAVARNQITWMGLAQLRDGIAQCFHIIRSRGSQQIGSEILVTTKQSGAGTSNRRLS